MKVVFYPADTGHPIARNLVFIDYRVDILTYQHLCSSAHLHLGNLTTVRQKSAIRDIGRVPELQRKKCFYGNLPLSSGVLDEVKGYGIFPLPHDCWTYLGVSFRKIAQGVEGQ